MPHDVNLILTRRAGAVAPRSINEQDRTVELVASTGADVPRIGIEGPYVERLAVSESAIDLSRLASMPLLDSHRQDGLDKVIGAVRSARIENGQLIVTVQISQRAEGIWQDIRSGIIKGVSIGYAPVETADSVENGQRVRTLTKWTLMEISLVPVPADSRATVRSANIMPQNIQTRAAVNQEIRALGQTFNVEAGVIDSLIDNESTVDEARAAVLQALQTRQNRPAPLAPRITMMGSSEAPEVITRAMGEALYCRVNPAHKPSDQARPYVNLTTLDIARDCLSRAGVSTIGLAPPDIVTRAFMTTSDFPNVLGDTANRILRAAYDALPATLKRVARQTTSKDFRNKSSIQIGEAPLLEKVNEHGEFSYGSLAESAERYRLATYGKIIALTRQAIVNDDLGAFTDLAGKFGRASAETEATLLVNLLTSASGLGPTMGDSVALFNAAHGNLAGTGAAPSETTLSAARLAMRKQTGLSGQRIGVVPRFLLVPPDLETTAEKLLTAIQANQTSNANPFAGKLELLVEPRLTDAFRWYLIADPASAEGLEYAYLQGSEGPQTETRAGWDIDGVETKVRLDFGAGFLDWRAWYMNPGH